MQVRLTCHADPGDDTASASCGVVLVGDYHHLCWDRLVVQFAVVCSRLSSAI